VKALIDPRSGRVCELREEAFAVAAPLFWLEVGDEVTTHYTYDGANVEPPPSPALEEVRGLAIERVEHRAEVELQAALGAKLPASVLLFQALSDDLALFEADQAPTVEKYPLLASLVGKRGAVDLQRAAHWWPSGGPGGFSAPPPSKRSGSRPWRISRLPIVGRRSTPCFSASIGAGLSGCLERYENRTLREHRGDARERGLELRRRHL
jgi:hypothetical protein